MAPILHQPENVQLLLVLVLLVAGTLWHLAKTASAPAYARRRRKPPDEPARHPYRGRRKSQWVRDEVTKLAALDPEGSCRKIAAAFCAMFHGIEKISRSWVAVFLRAEKYRIEALRKEIRRRKPGITPRNRIWALDLTGVPLGSSTKIAMGIIDHGTRACIALQHLRSKHSFVILRELAKSIRQFGKPAKLRTDNEAIFTSWLFRLGLRILDIQHQRIEKLAP